MFSRRPVVAMAPLTPVGGQEMVAHSSARCQPQWLTAGGPSGLCHAGLPQPAPSRCVAAPGSARGAGRARRPRDLASQRICRARASGAVRLSAGRRAAPPLLRRGRATRILGVSWAHRTRASLALCGRPAPPPRLLRRRRDSAPCLQVSDHRAPRGRGKGTCAAATWVYPVPPHVSAQAARRRRG